MMMEWKCGSGGDERGPFEVSGRRLMGPARIVKLPLFYQKPLSLLLGGRGRENLSRVLDDCTASWRKKREGEGERGGGV